MARPHSRKRCRHCQTRHINRPRGLCYTCYYTAAICELYPSESKYSPSFHEPTEEELEAIIAEQRANLPDWWEEQNDPRYEFQAQELKK